MPKSRTRRPAPQRRTAPRRSPTPPPVPPRPGLRGAVERRSAPLLVWLSSRPKLLLPVASLALLVGGLLAPPALGFVLLVVLLGVVGWLTYLSWPVIQGGARAVRVVTLVLLTAVAVSRLLA